MLDVIVALIPALGMSVYLFGPRVLALTLISVGACVLSEYLYRRLTHQSNTLRDCSACVTGLLLAMCLPAASPYWVPLLGGVFAIVVVKQFYGGLGKNFMNPALAGRMLLSTFPFLMTTWVDALDYLPVWGEMDAVTSPTPMAALHSGRLPELDMGQMLLGQHGGSIGEVSIFMLLLGGLYLIMRRVISPRIPAAFLGTVAVLTFLFPRWHLPGVDDGPAVQRRACAWGFLYGDRLHHLPCHPPGTSTIWGGLRPPHRTAPVLWLLPRRGGLGYPDHELPGVAHGPGGDARRFGVERFTAVREGSAPQGRACLRSNLSIRAAPPPCPGGHARRALSGPAPAPGQGPPASCWRW